MATNTYVALDKITLGTSASSVTFTSVSNSYTDLVLVVDGTWAGSNNFEAITLVFNSDTGSNYSRTLLQGNGSTVTSSRESTANWGLIASDQTNSIIHIMNYSNTTTYKTVLSRSGSALYAVRAVVGLWRSTSAITNIEVKTASNSFNSGTTFSLYGIKKEPQFSSKATGGAILYGADGYIYHTFTSGGTFTPNQSLSCQVLVVGGGGGGQAFYSGVGWGSGGDGGYVTYSSSSSFSATPYTVTIGAGGSGGGGNSGASGSTGSTSSVNSITAAGGTGATNGRGPGYGAGGTVSTYRNSPAAGIGVEYLGYKVAGGGWYGQNSQNIANYPVNSTQYGGGFQKGYTSASPSTLPYNGGGGAGGSNSSEGGTSAGQAGASGLVVIRYAG